MARRRTVIAAVAAAGVLTALVIALSELLGAPDTGGTVGAPVEPVGRPSPFGEAPAGGTLQPAGRPPGEPVPLWRVVDEGEVEATPPYSESWSEAGRVLVDVTAAASQARAWRVGDHLAVEMPALGGIREWTVEGIGEGFDARSRSVRGWIDTGGEWPRRIVVTVGPGRVLAYIDTPQGPYELTGNARLAWLLPSSSMMAEIDFSEPDYILPDRRRDDLETP